MQGLPVIVSGKTHYRSKGFTLDPKTWDEYFCQIEEVLEFAGSNWRLDSVKIDLAWQYSYRFFFTYPLPFPWHMVHLWKDYAQNPIGEVLSPEGQEKYSEAFQCLAGKHRNWKESEPEPDSRLETRETMVGK